MKINPKLAYILAFSFVLFTAPAGFAQGKGHGNGHGHENGQGNGHGNGKAKKANKNNGRTFAHATPHSVNVPPGQYPPAGFYRIWYPGRPPGQQPAPVRYGYPSNAPITADAFILYGDRAYDAQYDWRQEEVKKPKTVPRQIIDILFPNNTVPQQ